MPDIELKELRQFAEQNLKLDQRSESRHIRERHQAVVVGQPGTWHIRFLDLYLETHWYVTRRGPKRSFKTADDAVRHLRDNGWKLEWVSIDLHGAEVKK